MPQLGGAAKTLRATNAAGPEPELRPFAAPEDEAAAIVARVKELAGEGVALEETAVLLRTNARSADFEEAFHEAGLPFQGASLLARDAARQLLKRLRGAKGPLAETVERAAREQGLVDPVPDGLGERELTRQNDLGRLVRLARELDDGERDIGAWIDELHQRFGPDAGRGVHLLTLHRAKGLEWDAVFLPRIEEKELPSRLSKTDDEIAEERRLLYVGLTRARRHLWVSWAGRPSRFLRELGVAPGAGAGGGAAKPRGEKIRDEDLPPAYRALKDWRRERAQEDGVPAYVVFHDATLAEIVRVAPRSEAELAGISGVGPTKLERYGTDVLAVLSREPAALTG